MKTAMAAVVAALLAVFVTASSGAVSSRVTPVEKVLELLQGMLLKAQEGKKAEATQWAAYRQFCGDTEAGKQDRVKSANIKIESLEADLLFFKAEVERLGGEIHDHEADLVGYSASLSNATVERGNERKDYMALHQDYSESVLAVAKAIVVLKKQDYNRPQAALLLQRVAAVAPAKDRHAIEAFLEGDGDDLSLVGEPGEAHAYEFQSGGILELLQELSDKFVSKRTDLEKEEMERAHKYSMLALDLQNSMAAAKHEIAKKSETVANNKQAIADAETQHSELSATRDDDVAFLDELHTTCNQKASDFSSREDLRAGEIDALDKAIEILSGSAVKGAAATHLPSLLRKGGNVTKAVSTALVQTHSLRKTSAQDQAATFLQGASERLGSSILYAVSLRVRDDVFGKVKKMIQDLISRLEAEAAEEEDHKKWCDGELSTNGKTRTDKSQQIEGLTSTIGELQTRVAVLGRTIAELSKAISELTAAMAKAMELRANEKAENEDTIAEAVGAQGAVQQAITVLQDFYQEASKATALLQGAKASLHKGPPIFEKAYAGQQTESGNVIAFLQVIQSDFARLESQTSTAEESAQTEYETFVANAGADKTQKEKDVGEAKIELQQKEIDLETAKNDIELAQTELDTALEYYDKLKPSCISASTESSSDERIKRREQELESLTEALSILDGQTIVSGPAALYSSVSGGNVGLDVGVTAN